MGPKNCKSGTPKAAAASASGSAAKRQKVVAIEKADPMNAPHMHKLQSALDRIMAHEVFESVASMKPLPIGEGGTEAPFDGKAFKSAIDREGSYKSAGSFWWVRQHRCAGGFAKVPINQSAIDNLSSYHFTSVPAKFPSDIVVAVDSDSTIEFGKLDRLSPDELEHAFIFAIARQIDAGATNEELLAWRRVSLTVTISFEQIENETERLWRAVRLREQLTANFQNMARTALQRIYEVVEVRNRADTHAGGTGVSAQSLAAMYNDKGKLVGESMTANFIEQALTVHKVLLSNDTACKIVRDADEKWQQNSPFNSVTKLHTIVVKSKDATDSDLLIWILQTIIFLIDYKLVTAGELSLRVLQQQRGLLDLLAVKEKMKQYLLDAWIPDLGMSFANKDTLRTVFANHASYTLYFGGPDELNVDMTWQAGWSCGASMVSRLIAEAVYGVAHDATLKSAVRQFKSMDELLLLGSIGERVTAITEVLAQTAKEKSSEADAVVAVVSDEEAEPQGETKFASQNLEDAIGRKMASMSGDAKEKIQALRKKAEDHIKSNVVSIIEEDMNSPAKIKSAISNSHVGKSAKPDDSHKVVIFYDIKTCGEAVTNPMTRLPSFRPAHYKKCLSSYLNVDSMENGLPVDTVFVIFDAFKPGLERDILNVFVVDSDDGKGNKNMAKCHHKLGLVYSEESLKLRKDVCRGFMSLNQLEFVHIVTRSGLSGKAKNRLKFPGTTLGSLLSEVSLPAIDTLWHESVEMNKNFAERLQDGGWWKGGRPRWQARETEQH